MCYTAARIQQQLSCQLPCYIRWYSSFTQYKLVTDYARLYSCNSPFCSMRHFSNFFQYFSASSKWPRQSSVEYHGGQHHKQLAVYQQDLLVVQVYLLGSLPTDIAVLPANDTHAPVYRQMDIHKPALTCQHNEEEKTRPLALDSFKVLEETNHNYTGGKLIVHLYDMPRIQINQCGASRGLCNTQCIQELLLTAKPAKHVMQNDLKRMLCLRSFTFHSSS